MLFSDDPVIGATRVLMYHAGAEVWPAGRSDQRLLLRRARSAAHPDRTGDRTAWNAVEDAAQLLGLVSRAGEEHP